MPGIEYTTIAPATPEHPRNDSASIVELNDGTLWIVWMEFVGTARHGHDEAPNKIVSMKSPDGGRNWGSYRVEVAPNPGDVNVYNPCLVRMCNGKV